MKLTKTSFMRSFFIHFFAMTIIFPAFFTSWNEQNGPEMTSQNPGMIQFTSNHLQFISNYFPIISILFNLISPIYFILNSNLYLSISRARKRREKKKEEIWPSHCVLPTTMELPEKGEEKRRKKKRKL